MFTTFSVENFKAFKKLNINRLKRVNLITGTNSSGKTCFLESLFLFAGASQPALHLALCKWRGDEGLHPKVDYQFRYIFYDQDPNNHIKLAATGLFKRIKDAKLLKAESTLEIEPHLLSSSRASSTIDEDIVFGLDFVFTSNKRENKSKIFWEEVLVDKEGETKWTLKNTSKAIAETVPGRFISPRQPDMLQETSKQLSELVKQKRVSEVIELLKNIEPDLCDLATIDEEGRSIVYADIGKSKFYPLTSLGYGFFHFLRIALGALHVKDGILLIDEIENGIHHKVLRDLIKFIFNVAEKNNLQVFFTTHSEEVVREVVNYIDSNQYDDFELIRFFTRDDEKAISIYDASELMLAEEISVEIR